MSKKKREIPPIPCLDVGVSLIDTHCHLDMGSGADDCAGVVARSRAAGVTTVITIGIDCASSHRAIELAEEFDGVYAAVGVHPHHVAGLCDADYVELADLARHPKVVAFGEIGMDLVKKYAPEEDQRQHFTRQVCLGRDLKLPLIIHDREAHDAVMAILEEAAPLPQGGVMHCFSGDLALAERVLALGFYISIPGIVTYPSADDLREVARNVPLDRLLVETDAPYLAPDPRRGRTNEPSFLPYTAAFIAELRGISLRELACATSQNATRLFNLPLSGQAILMNEDAPCR